MKKLLFLNRKNQNIKNTLYFYDYYSRLKNIALSVFEWANLPETCNARFLERCLFELGQACFIKDDEMSYLNLKIAPSDTLNPYEEPIGFTANSTGYNKYFEAKDIIWIKNNYEIRPTDETIILYAERLAELERAIQVNINAQKTPVLVRCDKNTQKSLETIYKQYAGNMPVIFGAQSLQEKPLDVLKTDAPFVADKLREEKRAVWNEALEFLGMNTNPADKKKERLIVSEVASNNEQIDIQFQTMFLCRKIACEEINKRFGLNVSVKKRVEGETPCNDFEESEGGDNGEIYD